MTTPANDRDIAIAAIRKALKHRSGKSWSVTGGRGTSWGWIRIDAPPARCTWRHVESGQHDATGAPVYTEADSGIPNGGHMSPADRATLATLLGLETVHFQGVSIPASSDYRREYIARAEGRTPPVIGTPYWD